MAFNPLRLSIARQRRMLTKKLLAEKVGVAVHTITRIEQGGSDPKNETVSKIAEVLDYPREFFFGSDLEIPSADLVSFRSQRAMSAAERDAALAAGAIGFEVSDWIEGLFDLPRVDIPDLNLFDPETAAVVLRQDWGIGEEPISNLVHLLESKGVRVFSLAENSLRVNAFSLWKNDKPFVFLNTKKTSESSRFDASHELGHLILHQDGGVTGREAEDQANRFASAFLMPKSSVISKISSINSLNQIIQYKKLWKVSLLALVVRLHRLNRISDWQYRDFCIQIRVRYKNKEPNGIEREKSVVWDKVMKSLWADRTTFRDIATQLHLPDQEVSTLIFGMLHDFPDTPPVRGHSLALVKNDLIA